MVRTSGRDGTVRWERTAALLGIAGVIGALTWAVVRISPQPLFYLASDAQRALRWPDPSLRLEETYTQFSPVGALLFQWSGQSSVNAWVMLHLVAIGLAVVSLGLWLATTLPRGSPRTREVLRLLALSPLVALLVCFIGSYDPFTVISISLALFSWRLGSRWLLIAAGVGMGVSHAEQTFLAFGALAVASSGGKDLLPASLRGRPSLVWALIGIAIGRIALMLYLASQDVASGGGRIDWLTGDGDLRLATIGGMNFLPILITGAFAGLWALVVTVIGSSTSLRTSLYWAGSIIGLLLASVAVLDHTRVFVLTSLPIFLVLLSRYASTPRTQQSRLLRLSVEAMAWLIVPVFLLTSPDGPTFLVDINILDHWAMWLITLSSGGWS